MTIKNQSIWKILCLDLFLFLAACGTAVTDGGVLVASEDEVPAAQVDPALELEVEEPLLPVEELQNVEPELEKAPAMAEAPKHKVEILTEDDRPGGPPRDGIPSIDDPKFVSPDEASSWIAGNEPVIILRVNGDVRAYPLQIITFHEIVNDVAGGEPVVVTFCPLCNSALAFESTFKGQVLEFGVSGRLSSRTRLFTGFPRN